MVNCGLCGEKKCECDKKIKVYFCPKCKSNNVGYIFGFGNIFGIIPKMKCEKCGYTNSVFPILVTSKNALEKSDRKKKVVKRKVNRKRVKKNE